MSVANSSPRDSYRMRNGVDATALMVNAMLSRATRDWSRGSKRHMLIASATPCPKSKGAPMERVMHGFHASESQCSYGLTMHLVSFALAGIILGVVLLIR